MVDGVKDTLRHYGIIDRLKESTLFGRILRKYNGVKKKRGIRIFHRYGRECLERTSNAFYNAHVNFWLDYGTLLGAVREKDFIEHDSDLDIGALYAERNIDIETEMKKQGLKKNREFVYENRVLLETYSYKGVDIDIFYYFQEDNRIWSYTFDGSEGIKSRKIKGKRYITGYKTFKVTFTYTGFNKTYFKSGSYMIPSQVDLYLSEAYGEGFMIKDKNWDVSQMRNRVEAGIKDVVCIYYIN